MSLISYAQNFEDVILWRALKHIDCGFYIDIGAQDPVVDSISLAFYERGWRGVHVEPTAHYADRLRSARPDEEVIQAAIGTRMKSRVFYEIPETGLSTGSRAIAERHEQQGFEIHEVRVSCLPLSDILDGHRDRPIHWLKIDVEGMEQQVIRTWRPSQVRPWIVVVESTEPLSPKPSFASWEPLLIELGYEFAYFDGLNRFYVSLVHPELRASFGAGPNIFDDFVLSGFASGPLHQQLAGRAGENVRLSQAIEGLRAEGAAQAANFGQATAVWERASAALQAELSAKNEALASRDQHIAALDSVIGRVNEETSNLRQYLAESAEETVRLSQAMEGLRAEAAGQMASFAEAAAVWESARAALNAELSAKTDALASRDQQIATLDSEVARRAEESVRLSQAMEGLRVEAAVQAASFAEAAAVWEGAGASINAKLSAKNDALAGMQQAIEKHNAWARAAMANEAALKQEVGVLEAQLAAAYRSTSWRVTAPPRFVSRTTRWFVQGTWAWITLKPGSRPRRVARASIASLANRVVQATARTDTAIRSAIPPPQPLAQPSLSQPEIPDISPPANNGAILDMVAVGQSDLTAETEDVRRLYQRLGQARVQVMEGR